MRGVISWTECWWWLCWSGSDHACARARFRLWRCRGVAFDDGAGGHSVGCSSRMDQSGGLSLRFYGFPWAVGIFTVGAIGEFVADLLPNTPARTAAGGLIARIVIGSLSGACLGVAGTTSPWAAALLGAVGAFGGYQTRVGLVRALEGSGFRYRNS